MSDFASFDMAEPDPVGQGNQQQGGYYPPDQSGGYPPQQQSYGQPTQQPPQQSYGQQPMGGMGLPGGFGMVNSLAGNQMAGVAQGLMEEKLGAGLKDISVAAGQLKYYFQVDTRYVMKKTGLLLFPFIPGTQWSRNGKDGKFLPPKDDINSPDLYIPVMAFLTYVLVAGVIMGSSASGEFSASELGTLLSNAWGFLLVEVLVCYAGVWLLNLADITIYDIVAYTGYKFIGMVLTLLSYLGTNSDMVFHGVLLWTAAALSFNLMQTIRHSSESPKLLYFAIALVTAQVFFMWWFTSSVTTPIAVPEVAAKLGKGMGKGMGKMGRK